MTPTSLADVDKAIDALHAKKEAWTKVPIAERIALLDGCVAATAKAADKWVELGAAVKGLAPNEAGEEWVAGVLPTMRNARLLADSLRAVAAGGKPKAKLRKRRDGRWAARVTPASTMDALMFTGITADVWIAPGEEPTQGALYRAAEAERKGGVALVLGGGNVSSIPPMDALYKLFVDDEVVLLKMNPVNESLGPVLEEALKPLVDGGWLKIVYGGAEVGAHAAQHAKIASLHVTGSDRTYDAIVWGPNKEKKGKRTNDKPFSAELGCVTPVIVVPGPWSSRDIRFQARHVASMVTQNASFNCNAAKVIVTARGWLQRDAFLAAVHEELKKTPARKAYYPGARDRYDAFKKEYPQALVLGSAGSGEADAVPWTAIPDVSADAGGYALTHEAFCGVVAEVALGQGDEPGGPTAEAFLAEAVAFANDKCWGTLSCAILVHPVTEEDHHEALVSAVEKLRYGTIAINAWPGLVYALAAPSWGAFPGHTPEDIQSGTGVVHNTALFDHVERTVLRAPFRIRPTPPWFSDHKNLLEVGKRLVAFEAAPSWGNLLKVALAAARG